MAVSEGSGRAPRRHSVTYKHNSLSPPTRLCWLLLGRPCPGAEDGEAPALSPVGRARNQRGVNRPMSTRTIFFPPPSDEASLINDKSEPYTNAERRLYVDLVAHVLLREQNGLACLWEYPTYAKRFARKT